MVDLLCDDGPCSIDDNQNVQYNRFSWNNVRDMIYIDQPTLVGFSYTILVDSYVDPNSSETITVPGGSCTTNAATNVWKALQGLMGGFPQYARSAVHLATESYGGHYGPIFAEYFEQQNAAGHGQRINLQSLSVGNGWYDLRIQYPAYYNYTVAPGNTYDYSSYNSTMAAEVYNAFYGSANCLDQLSDCNTHDTDSICSAADNFCYDIEAIVDSITGRREYDIRELSPIPFPPLQRAIGAFTNFTYAVTNFGAGTVATAFGTTRDDARELEIIAANQNLLKKGVSILQYVCGAGYNCNWLGGEAVAAEINAAGWEGAGYQNFTTTTDGKVHGVVKQAGNFTFVRVYDAGHSVPFYQPLVALEMFERLLSGTDIATGLTKVSPSYLSKGPAKTYRNGSSTIQQDVVDPSCNHDSATNLPVCAGNGTKARRRRV
ncbi:hypothetical protein LTR62_007254 [Meristemomyces frigidus]|uniref:Carboxypeptidase n=1 Tax=Meristemomyces frigidus TaxID=1508187 RepID=A0AAN7TBY1_9PEZI|nr:hypothetical protein LTR62_007254 [Meristemomyces frigidus]